MTLYVLRRTRNKTLEYLAHGISGWSSDSAFARKFTAAQRDAFKRKHPHIKGRFVIFRPQGVK